MKFLLSMFFLLFVLNFGMAKTGRTLSIAPKEIQNQVTLKPQPSLQDQGFQGVPWGADEATIITSLGNQVEKLAEREVFGNNAYADLSIPGYVVSGVTMKVYFQMDKQTNRLKQVLLQKYNNDTSYRSFNSEYEILTALLSTKYGIVSQTGDFKRRWNKGDTSVELDNSFMEPIKTEHLWIRYFPSSNSSGKL